jgi:hypothetical protein
MWIEFRERLLDRLGTKLLYVPAGGPGAGQIGALQEGKQGSLWGIGSSHVFIHQACVAALGSPQSRLGFERLVGEARRLGGRVGVEGRLSEVPFPGQKPKDMTSCE